MSEKLGSFNSKSVPTYRTRTFTKKAYRTNVHTRTVTEKAYRTSVPYFLAKIEAYRTISTYRTAILDLMLYLFATEQFALIINEFLFCFLLIARKHSFCNSFCNFKMLSKRKKVGEKFRGFKEKWKNNFFFVYHLENLLV